MTTWTQHHRDRDRAGAGLVGACYVGLILVPAWRPTAGCGSGSPPSFLTLYILAAAGRHRRGDRARDRLDLRPVPRSGPDLRRPSYDPSRWPQQPRTGADRRSRARSSRRSTRSPRRSSAVPGCPRWPARRAGARRERDRGRLRRAACSRWRARRPRTSARCCRARAAPRQVDLRWPAPWSAGSASATAASRPPPALAAHGGEPDRARARARARRPSARARRRCGDFLDDLVSRRVTDRENIVARAQPSWAATWPAARSVIVARARPQQPEEGDWRARVLTVAERGARGRRAHARSRRIAALERRRRRAPRPAAARS